MEGDVQMSMVHIFWDNSNIHFVGLNTVFPLKEPGVDRELFRTYFKNLFDLAHRGRQVGKAYLAGSIPPDSDALWAHIRSLNVRVELLKRTNANKENANDVSIQANMLRTAFDRAGTNDTFVVLTGDGAGKALGIGFLADLERISKQGFGIEVISWDAGCNRALKSFAEDKGRFIPLEAYYDQITFIKNGRFAKPLTF